MGKIWTVDVLGCTFSGFLLGVMEAQFVAIPRIGVDESREERTAQVCRGNPATKIEGFSIESGGILHQGKSRWRSPSLHIGLLVDLLRSPTDIGIGASHLF